MDAQQNDELYPIAVLIDELKVRPLSTLSLHISASDALYSMTMFCSD
jgi:hypothetical protein